MGGQAVHERQPPVVHGCAQTGDEKQRGAASHLPVADRPIGGVSDHDADAHSSATAVLAQDRPIRVQATIHDLRTGSLMGDNKRSKGSSPHMTNRPDVTLACQLINLL
jgi:hypothetical protein